MQSKNTKLLYTMLASFLIVFLIPVKLLYAANLSQISINLSRVNELSASKYTILFKSSSGVAAGQSISITLPVGFVIGSSFDFDDVSLFQGSTGNCSTATYTPKTLAAVPSGTTWGFSVSGQVLTFTSGTDTLISDRCVRIFFEDNGTNNQILNPSVPSDQAFNISFVSGVDNGQAAVVILNDDSTPDGDQVQLNGNVLTSIILDLDTVLSNCVNSTEVAVSTVNFGSLQTATLRKSGSEVNFICVDIGTNALNGMKVFVRSSRANIVGGLVSGGNAIDSATADLNLIGVSEGYGLRVQSLGVADFGTFSSFSPFNSTTSGSVGLIPGLLSLPAVIFGSTAPARSGLSNRVALELAAKVSTFTPPGNYSDILTFTAIVNL